MTYVKEFWDILRSTFFEWRSDRAPLAAASLAYYAAFSMAPLVIIVVSITGFVVDQNQVQQRIINEIQSTIGSQAATIISDSMNNMINEKQGIISTLLGFGALLLGALGFFSNLQTVLDEIWNVADVEQQGGVRGFLRDKLLSFGMILVIGFLLLVSLLLNTALSFLDDYLLESLPQINTLVRIISWLASYFITTLLFMLIYKFLPHAYIRWRDVIVGSAVTSLLFIVGQVGIGEYLSNSATASAYGAAGSLVLILLWVYYSAQILLFGAEFTQVYAQRYGKTIVAFGERHIDDTPEPKESESSQKQVTD